MKLTSSLIIFASAFIISSCGSGEQNADSNVSTDTVKVAAGPTEITDMTGVTAYYECPMKCEGKKFAEAGACPVCGMELVKVDTAATPEEHHDHDSTHQH